MDVELSYYLASQLVCGYNNTCIDLIVSPRDKAAERGECLCEAHVLHVGRDVAIVNLQFFSSKCGYSTFPGLEDKS